MQGERYPGDVRGGKRVHVREERKGWSKEVSGWLGGMGRKEIDMKGMSCAS